MASAVVSSWSPLCAATLCSCWTLLNLLSDWLEWLLSVERFRPFTHVDIFMTGPYGAIIAIMMMAVASTIANSLNLGSFYGFIASVAASVVLTTFTKRQNVWKTEKIKKDEIRKESQSSSAASFTIRKYVRKKCLRERGKGNACAENLWNSNILYCKFRGHSKLLLLLQLRWWLFKESMHNFSKQLHLAVCACVSLSSTVAFY